ncbi:transglycosylase SLT domain-containing protein [Streptomyces sp. NPDC057445]|uniref:transglycosylase SLT domain-containing protein n=1 Tax=Streptomyces sp. NPDC057445 TaxID=3346136 RepID=UPI00367562A4
MFASRTSGSARLSKTHKFSIAGVAAVGASALAFSLVPGNASAQTEPQTQAVSSSSVAWSTGVDTAKAAALQASIANQSSFVDAKAKLDAKTKADAAAALKAKAEAQAAAKAKAAAATKAKAQAAAKQRAEQAASRAAARKPVYANNLDGWIRESLDIMKKHNIPGTYEGIHRNIMRESSGNPRAINNWDINAINGVPSKGLLQIIKPTFDTYHVAGTAWDQYDPVANIVASCNYAADRYGSMDNVNSAY